MFAAGFGGGSIVLAATGTASEISSGNNLAIVISAIATALGVVGAAYFASRRRGPTDDTDWQAQAETAKALAEQRQYEIDRLNRELDDERAKRSRR